MAQPTQEQTDAVRALEKAHKNLFYSLAAATAFWMGLSEKYAALPRTDPRKMAMLNYGNKVTSIYVKWKQNQRELERAGVAKIPLEASDFFDRSKRPYINQLVATMNADATQGKNAMGFIPLLIWAVVAIIAFYTTEKIVEKVDSTEAQQKELVESTNNFCAEQKLSQQDCKDIFTKQQASIQSSNENQGGGILDTFKSLLLWGGLGYVGFQLIKSQSKKAA